MFDDINLLPEDLRKKEEREKNSNQGGGASSELSYPKSAKEDRGHFDFLHIKEKKIEEPKLEPRTPVKEVKKTESKGFLAKLKIIFQKNNKVPKIILPKENQPIADKEKPKSDQPILKPAIKEMPVAPLPPKTENKAEELAKEKIEPKKPLNKIDEKKAIPADSKSFSSGLSQGDKLNSPVDFLAVNLVPAASSLKSFPEIISYFIWVTIINILVVGVVCGLIGLYGRQVTKDASAQDKLITQKLKIIKELKSSESEAALLVKKVNLIKGLLANHLYWTNFYQALEDNTLSNVYYNSFAATNDGNITLAATTDSYLSVAKQLQAFEQAPNFIKEAKVMSADKAPATADSPALVRFSISIKLNPRIFLKSLNNGQQ